MSAALTDATPARGETVIHIVARLREDILARRIAPGERLVEIELTNRFAVSRGPIREALRRLAAEGFIEHAPNRGAVVRRLSAREIGELFQIRMELEALAARSAAAAATDLDKRSQFAASIAPIFKGGPRRSCDYLVENADFHGAIFDLAGNLQLRDLALRLHLPLIMAQVADVLTPEVIESSVREHRALAEAILARQQADADAAMRAHLRRACKLALAHAESRDRGEL